ncbi:tricalbin-1-related [Anaeramoeba flamelloides]|uniref:Tricalbin-1-related n=1 Tax=Anaeramoeba flamelloides TaxID=1746091 RepID=A0AAV7ZUK8_9EUKA|nr:tricalbin-1-related [Anaeramoeba flamelloides]KAJ6237994.1 tricalbin-1-related [Anaeramoeba flamelloides]
MSKQIQLEVYFNKALNLIPSDFNGKSDPYCKVLLDGKKLGKCKKKKKTLNPVWNERKTFKLKGTFEQLYHKHISINVMDWDLISSDDFIGFWKGIQICELPPNKEVQYIDKLTKVKSGSLNISLKLVTPKEVQKKWEEKKLKKKLEITKEKAKNRKLDKKIH